MIKHAEQTNSCESSGKYSVSQDRHLKVETAETRTCQFNMKIFVCTDSETIECQSHAALLLNGRPQFYVHLYVVFISDMEEQVLTEK